MASNVTSHDRQDFAYWNAKNGHPSHRGNNETYRGQNGVICQVEYHSTQIPVSSTKEPLLVECDVMFLIIAF